MVDNTLDEVFANEWKFIAIKKDKQKIWRKLI